MHVVEGGAIDVHDHRAVAEQLADRAADVLEHFVEVGRVADEGRALEHLPQPGDCRQGADGVRCTGAVHLDFVSADFQIPEAPKCRKLHGVGLGTLQEPAAALQVPEHDDVAAVERAPTRSSASAAAGRSTSGPPPPTPRGPRPPLLPPTVRDAPPSPCTTAAGCGVPSRRTPAAIRRPTRPGTARAPHAARACATRDPRPARAARRPPRPPGAPGGPPRRAARAAPRRPPPAGGPDPAPAGRTPPPRAPATRTARAARRAAGRARAGAGRRRRSRGAA